MIVVTKEIPLGGANPGSYDNSSSGEIKTKLI